MAITPQEAEALTDALRKKLQDLEKYLDQRLRENWGAQKDRRLAAAWPSTISWKEQQLLKSHIETLYVSAGWCIKFVSDQRDEDWIEFSVPEKPKPHVVNTMEH